MLGLFGRRSIVGCTDAGTRSFLLLQICNDPIENSGRQTGSNWFLNEWDSKGPGFKDNAAGCAVIYH